MDPEFIYLNLKQIGKTKFRNESHLFEKSVRIFVQNKDASKTSSIRPLIWIKLLF